MRKLYFLTSLFLFLIFAANTLHAQGQKISGRLTDKNTRQPLAFANIIIKGTTTGVTTDINGNYELTIDSVNKSETILQISYVGYSLQELTVGKGETTLNIVLEPAVIFGKEIVVTGSRISETIRESSASIQKMNSREIKEVASGDFYEGMGNLKGIDINQSSMGFKVVNMRGFNSTAPVRIVQFIDGMDNQAPGLNFPVGNLVGASDIDLQSVEIITGAASALYGPNAFQGVVSMTTKNPYDFPGTSVQLKGGTNNLAEGQLRYAEVFGKDKKWAAKVTASYIHADDWIANDPVANNYGAISTVQDLSTIVRGLKYSSDPDQAYTFTKINDWLDFNQEGFRGLGKKTINAPGYMETSLSDNTTKSLKLGAEIHYKFNDDIQASYVYKFGQGTAVYQGSNRYSINNIRFHQHKIELAGKRFSLKAYKTFENAGDSYDIVFTGINISKAGVPNYISNYLTTYFTSLSDYTNSFVNDLQSWMVDSAASQANSSAGSAWYKPGTAQFDSVKSASIKDPHLSSGSKFLDQSSLTHFEGQYNFDFPFADVIAGESVRLFNPKSYGTIFSDTLINPADTLVDGKDNPNGEYVNLATYEIGGFIQASKKVFSNDNNKLTLTGSVRLDKNKNYNAQTSPRLSAVYTHKDNTFRLSAQSAFRAPTLQNQYLLLDIGPIILMGNLQGVDNLYTLESVQAFNTLYDSAFEINPALLKTTVLAPIQPEQVKTIELGYRGILINKVYVDATVYYSIYHNFIGETRVIHPKGDAIAGQDSGLDAVLAKSYQVYQIPVNAKEQVTSYGGTIGLAYYLKQNYTVTINYTYSDLNTSKLSDAIIPGFNTPKHKINAGLKGRKIYKDLGFSTNIQWVDTYQWQSTFGDGTINSYRIVDLQLSYDLPKIHSVFRLGASNILDEKRREAYGSPTIGRMVYTSWLFEI